MFAKTYGYHGCPVLSATAKPSLSVCSSYPIIKVCVTTQIIDAGKKDGYLKKKKNSKAKKRKRNTSTPGVFPSTMYQLIIEKIIANKVPPVRQRNPKIDWPALCVMAMATMIMAHTIRCCWKKIYVETKDNR